MKRNRIIQAACAVGLSAACVWGMVGCSNSGQTSDTSDAIAATVNGVEIPESTITNYIESVRSQQGLTDEDSWGNYLAQNSMTPSDVRDQVIDTYVSRELIKEGADEKGVTVDSSEIDSYVDKMKANYDSDEKWQDALSQAGMTEDEYRSEIELQLKAKYLYDTFTSDEQPSDEDMLQYAQMYASAYDGAKRSSHILFSSDDEATAQDVLNRINSGELDFVDAVHQYSQDTASAEKDGDVGWDKTQNLVTEYTDALAGLEKDQISGLITSQYGIHIIKCTDVYNAPKETAEDGTQSVKVTSLDQIPSDWQDSIKQSLQSQGQSTAYQEWLQDAKDSADLVKNDMPSGLPYDIDMSKYTSDDSSDASADSGSTDNGSDSAQGDATDSEDASADSGSDATSGDAASTGTDAQEGQSASTADSAGNSATE